MFQTIKTVFKMASYVTFCFFSMSSVRDFIAGRVEYLVVQEKDDTLLFPSVTLCPRDESDVFINTSIIREELNVPRHSIAGSAGWRWMKRLNSTQLYQVMEKYFYNDQNELNIQNFIK